MYKHFPGTLYICTNDIIIKTNILILKNFFSMLIYVLCHPGNSLKFDIYDRFRGKDQMDSRCDHDQGRSWSCFEWKVVEHLCHVHLLFWRVVNDFLFIFHQGKAGLICEISVTGDRISHYYGYCIIVLLFWFKLIPLTCILMSKI